MVEKVYLMVPYFKTVETAKTHEPNLTHLRQGLNVLGKLKIQVPQRNFY